MTRLAEPARGSHRQDRCPPESPRIAWPPHRWNDASLRLTLVSVMMGRVHTCIEVELLPYCWVAHWLFRR
jgi:hypothetical protein